MNFQYERMRRLEAISKYLTNDELLKSEYMNVTDYDHHFFPQTWYHPRAFITNSAILYL